MNPHYNDCSNLSNDDKVAGYTTAGWYFVDETEAGVFGPYVDERTCIKQAKIYGAWLHTPEINSSNYISHVLRTESMTDAIENMKKDRVLGILLNTLSSLVEYANSANKVKRVVFYSEKIDDLLPLVDMSKTRHPVIHVLRRDDVLRLIHCILGLLTEAGELAKAVMDSVETGNVIDWNNVKEELGDALWYLGVGIDVQQAHTSADFDEVLRYNIAKLRARYPEKFTREQALNRDLETERQLLEGGKDA